MYNDDLVFLMWFLWMLTGSFVSGALAPRLKEYDDDCVIITFRYLRIAVFWPYVLLAQLGNSIFNKSTK